VGESTHMYVFMCMCAYSSVRNATRRSHPPTYTHAPVRLSFAPTPISLWRLHYRDFPTTSVRDKNFLSILLSIQFAFARRIGRIRFLILMFEEKRNVSHVEIAVSFRFKLHLQTAAFTLTVLGCSNCRCESKILGNRLTASMLKDSVLSNM
jgi:hypothetical protein